MVKRADAEERWRAIHCVSCCAPSRSPGARGAASPWGFRRLPSSLARPRDAGILLTLTSVGSLIGGLAYGRQAWSVPLELRYALLLGVIALTALPLALVDDLRQAAPFAIVLGLGWAPAMSCQYALVGRAAPAGSVTEAFTWQTSAFVGGASAGAAIAGALAESAGARSTFVLLAACALTASAVARAVRRRIGLSVARCGGY